MIYRPYLPYFYCLNGIEFFHRGYIIMVLRFFCNNCMVSLVSTIFFIYNIWTIQIFNSWFFCAHSKLTNATRCCHLHFFFNKNSKKINHLNFRCLIKCIKLFSHQLFFTWKFLGGGKLPPLKFIPNLILKIPAI